VNEIWRTDDEASTGGSPRPAGVLNHMDWNRLNRLRRRQPGIGHGFHRLTLAIVYNEFSRLTSGYSRSIRRA
jgi:hypothetical protein